MILTISLFLIKWYTREITILTMSKKHLITSIFILLIGVIVVFYFADIPFPPRFFDPSRQVATVPDSFDPTTPPTPTQKEPLTYSALTIETTDPRTELVQAVGEENIDTVLGINRIDLRFVQKGMTLSIPDDFTRPEDFFPFPTTVESASSIPKLILVAQHVQAFGIYEHGTLVRSGPISSGKESTPTPSGLYFTNWRGRDVISTVNDEWIMDWYFNIENKEGISVHEYELPGYPASHSCVRLRTEDAKWIHGWAKEWVLSENGWNILVRGTPVILFGTYNHDGVAPWKLLSENPTATTVSENEVENILNHHLYTIETYQQDREEYEDSKQEESSM